MSELKKFTGPYSSTLVANYEPMFLDWIGITTWRILQHMLSNRIVKIVDRRSPIEHVPMWDKVRWKPISYVKYKREEDEPFQTVFEKGWDAKDLKKQAVKMEKVFNEALKDPDTIISALKNLNIPFFVSEKFGNPIVAKLIRFSLSPIGIMHLYRQLYFSEEEGIGPVEQAFSIAPNETVEIIQESTRRRVFEQIEEFGTETSTESEREERTQDDISDQVDSKLKRDLKVGISAEGGANFVVWNFGANLTTDIGLSTESSRQRVKKHMSSITKRVSETFRKSYSLRLRTVEEVTEHNMLRRIVTNETEKPVNYGLRRILRKVKVKLQSLGPRICWQIYIRNPGQGLARSRFVLFREADPVTIPGVPPGAPPPPQGGEATGSQVIGRPSSGPVEITVYSDASKEITGLVVNSIVDVSPDGGKDVPTPPAVVGVIKPKSPQPSNLPEGASLFQATINWGDAKAVELHYTYYYKPSKKALDDWQKQVNTIRNRIEEQQLQDQFENAKKLITEKSKIRSRPSSDLRAEERSEILARMIRELFGQQTGGVTPVEIEFFHRYFDVSALFYYIHPSWWKPQYKSAGGIMKREDYEITDESDPAPLGKSLGWLIQLDGDSRRNEFLNSPWVRVCLPFRRRVEREGVNWLSEHIEGNVGLSLQDGSEIDNLLKDIEKQRKKEDKNKATPEYLTQIGEEAPAPQDAVDAYPVVDEYSVIIPTEGFIYDELTVQDGN